MKIAEYFNNILKMNAKSALVTIKKKAKVMLLPRTAISEI